MRLGYEIFHRDLSTAVDFYVNVLGFEASDSADSADYVVVHRGEVRVGCCLREDAETTERRPPKGSEIVLRIEDVEAEYDRVVATGWPIADALRERPWGLTDFRLFDPSGQYLRITNSAARS